MIRLPDLLIFGGGGHGKAVIDLVRAIGGYQIMGVLDDSLPVGSQVMGVPVLGGANRLTEIRASGVTLATNAVGGIGNPAVRKKIFDLLQATGFDLPVLVHPSAVIEPSARLEAGVQVCPLAYIGSESHIGFGSVINIHANAPHDSHLGQVTNLSPGAMLAGTVTIGDFTQVGMNATINLGLTIGAHCFIGNNATVKADVPDGTRVRAGSLWPIRTESVK